jgi:hypothetical protein
MNDIPSVSKSSSPRCLSRRSPAPKSETLNFSEVSITGRKVQIVFKGQGSDPDIVFGYGAAALPELILDSAIRLGRLHCHRQDRICLDEVPDLDEVML